MANDIHIARISGNKCPCYKCDDRYPGCHGYCDRYKQYRQVLDEVNEKARMDNKLRYDLIGSSRHSKKKGSQI